MDRKVAKEISLLTIAPWINLEIKDNSFSLYCDRCSGYVMDRDAIGEKLLIFDNGVSLVRVLNVVDSHWKVVHA